MLLTPKPKTTYNLDPILGGGGDLILLGLNKFRLLASLEPP